MHFTDRIKIAWQVLFRPIVDWAMPELTYERVEMGSLPQKPQYHRVRYTFYRIRRNDRVIDSFLKLKNARRAYPDHDFIPHRRHRHV